MRCLHNDATSYAYLAAVSPPMNASDISDDPRLYEKTLIVHFDSEPYCLTTIRTLCTHAFCFHHVLFFTTHKKLAKWHSSITAVNCNQHPHVLEAAKLHLE